ncbi:penicillin-binding protein [Leifsonia xyli subsp. cynodontis DSM 46306]|uniref:Uncharacterized protein n=1 Tax=Leifsonia xyli subsp. cynodontis DSM 46306 TaxID=1389489 RepID=U3PBB4_LEIXC|nr:hypothetical protein [Leifsonia xyli]AGW40788.1 penicillin-binding protein [Leifsonia xyli subsp. cynodontis DSM 46306]
MWNGGRALCSQSSAVSSSGRSAWPRRRVEVGGLGDRLGERSVRDLHPQLARLEPGALSGGHGASGLLEPAGRDSDARFGAEHPLDDDEPGVLGEDGGRDAGDDLRRALRRAQQFGAPATDQAAELRPVAAVGVERGELQVGADSTVLGEGEGEPGVVADGGGRIGVHTADAECGLPEGERLGGETALRQDGEDLLGRRFERREPRTQRRRQNGHIGDAGGDRGPSCAEALGEVVGGDAGERRPRGVQSAVGERDVAGKRGEQASDQDGTALCPGRERGELPAAEAHGGETGGAGDLGEVKAEFVRTDDDRGDAAGEQPDTRAVVRRDQERRNAGRSGDRLEFGGGETVGRGDDRVPLAVGGQDSRAPYRSRRALPEGGRLRGGRRPAHRPERAGR